MELESSLRYSQEPADGLCVNPLTAFHRLMSCFFKIYASTHLRLCPSRDFLPSCFQTKIIAAVAPIRAMCPAHPVTLYLITLILSGEKDKL